MTTTREDRLNSIIDILTAQGKVQSSELVNKFNVTDMTIRRDLDMLVSRGKIVRTHGGAVLADPDESKKGLMLEPAYISRVSEQNTEKMELSTAALKLIAPNQFVFLDSGSTTLEIARTFPREKGCFIITNGINIASELIAHQIPNVITLGGEIDLNTWSTRGPMAEAQIDQFHADIAFLGCNAISSNGDVMIGNLAEITIKKKVMNISHKIYLVADSSKFGHYSLSSYARLNDFDGIITDHALPEQIRESICQAGGNLILSSDK